MFVHYIISEMNNNIVIELPTGHGKTPIIACLAKCIADTYPDCKVFVVTMNSYLVYHAHENYAIK